MASTPLAAAAAAAGLDLGSDPTPAAVLSSAASRLRAALDDGADARSPAVGALLALSRDAASSCAPGEIGSAALASALGVSAARVAVAAGEAVGRGGAGGKSVLLAPRAAAAETEKVLQYLREDILLGQRVQRERAEEARMDDLNFKRLRQGRLSASNMKMRRLAAEMAAAGVTEEEAAAVLMQQSAAIEPVAAGRSSMDGTAVGGVAVGGNTHSAGRYEVAAAAAAAAAAASAGIIAPAPISAGNGVGACMPKPQGGSSTPVYAPSGALQQRQAAAATAAQLYYQQQQQQRQQQIYLQQQAAAIMSQQQSLLQQQHAQMLAANQAAKAADEAAYAALHAEDMFMGALHSHFGPSPPAVNLAPPRALRAMLAERERVLYRLVQQRQARLGAEPDNMAEDVRRASIMEGKRLRLIELQRVVRYRVTSEQRKMLAMPLSHSADAAPNGVIPNDDLSRLYYRSSPPVYSYTDGYPRANILHGTGEPPPRTQQTIAVECGRMAHFDASRMAKQSVERKRVWCAKLMAHHGAFSSFHGVIWNNRNRVMKGFARHFVEKKKAEERRKKQEQVERLRLLRSNDEEAYMQLLKNTKNERLLQLVSQTDAYMQQIGAQIEKTRDASMDVMVEVGDPGVVDTSDGVEKSDTVDTMLKKRSLYYTVTHRVTEEVRQPSIMVNGTLKPYQLEGLRWMVSLYNNNLNGILADEMGLGKTIQTISLITYLIEMKSNPGPYLIIVPLSTLGNWVREFEKWAPSVVKVVYRGDATARRNIYDVEMALGGYNVLLTTYEFVVRDQHVLSRMSWKYIIIDEGHRMKNANSKMAVTLGVRYRSRNRILLTGTPLQNNLTELWALLNFLLPSIFSSAETFEQWFQKPFEETTMGDTAELEEEETYLIINRLHQVLRPFLLRRLKTDVESQLPDKVETVIRCDMSVWQRVLYRQMQKKITVATGEGGGGNGRRFNNLLMQLKKICNHPYIFYEADEIAKLPEEMLIRSSGKFSLLAHMLAKLKRAGHRTLIFSQMTTALDYMEDFLCAIDIRYMRLDGNTKAEDRQGMLNEFNAKDSPYVCFLLSTRAGGLGLNLQTADTVIIFDSDWNPMMDLQAQDRAHRIGQTKEVRVIRLISAGTVEVKILDQANRKLHVDAQVIQAGQFNTNATDTDRETMLKSILRQQTDESENMGDRCPDKEEVNRMLARSDEEFELYQLIDEERAKTAENEELMVEESELPSWVLQPEVDHKTAEEREQEAMLTHGRGRRKHRAVPDADQLTEKEWLDVMEGELTLEDALARRKNRIARRRLSLGRTGSDDDADGSEEDYDAPLVVDTGDSSDGGTRRKRRRASRKSKSAPKDPVAIKRRRSSTAREDLGEREAVTAAPKRRRLNGSTPVPNGRRCRPPRIVPVAASDADDSDEDDRPLDDMRSNVKPRSSGRTGRRSVAFSDEVKLKKDLSRAGRSRRVKKITAPVDSDSNSDGSSSEDENESDRGGDASPGKSSGDEDGRRAANGRLQSGHGANGTVVRTRLRLRVRAPATS